MTTSHRIHTVLLATGLTLTLGACGTTATENTASTSETSTADNTAPATPEPTTATPSPDTAPAEPSQAQPEPGDGTIPAPTRNDANEVTPIGTDNHGITPDSHRLNPAGEVLEIVDGTRIRAELNGETTTIELLGVTIDDDSDNRAAAELLDRLAPAGSEVVLEWDPKIGTTDDVGYTTGYLWTVDPDTGDLHTLLNIQPLAAGYGDVSRGDYTNRNDFLAV